MDISKLRGADVWARWTERAAAQLSGDHLALLGRGRAHLLDVPAPSLFERPRLVRDTFHLTALFSQVATVATTSLRAAASTTPKHRRTAAGTDQR